MRTFSRSLVIPAKAGIQGRKCRKLQFWIPAFAGMTKEDR